MDFTTQSLAQRLTDFGLATTNQLDGVWSEMTGNKSDLDDFKTLLLRKGVVTNYQLDRILTGERLGFFYGPYKVLYMIGAGTFARVFRAVHTQTNRGVAIKVLRRRHREQVAEVEQFLREGRMGLELKHPNIVAIYDIVNDPRTPYLVMEFVEGETLREILKIRKKFSPIEALRVVQDICTGLDFAMQKGVTHRDLKLSNVLVAANGRCKLVDFGLAAIADTSSPEALADCPSARAIDYATLERATGVRRGDVRSDVFFVGIMLQHIISGEPPMSETRDRMARLNVTRFTSIPSIGSLVPDLPPSVGTIVNKAIEFDPVKRYQSPAAMLAEVQAVLQRLESGQVDGKTTEHIVVKVDEEAAKEGLGKTVMVIESRLELQDVLRERLKSRGYRVLVFSDPGRAIERFKDDGHAADCVLIGATELSFRALTAFNQMQEAEHTAKVPTIMLIDPKQQQLKREAKLDKTHTLLEMPLKVRELRASLLKLIAPKVKPDASHS
jgi:eukaryotic-like serine/threonine-protein kinase